MGLSGASSAGLRAKHWAIYLLRFLVYPSIVCEPTTNQLRNIMHAVRSSITTR